MYKSKSFQKKYIGQMNLISAISAGNANSKSVTDEFFSASSTKKLGGSSSSDGIVTSPSNNKCFIRGNVDKLPISDSGDIIFGRVTSSITVLTGTLAFTQNAANVTGVGTLFTTELVVGNYIKLNANGKYYKILSITDDTHLTLTSNFLEFSASGAASKATITLSYLKLVVGVETAHVMSNESIDIDFPESNNLYDVPFDAFFNNMGFGGGGGGGQSILPSSEDKTIVSLNTVPDLDFTPIDNNHPLLWIDGLIQPQNYFTIAGTSVTWNFGTAGFNINPGDKVKIFYLYSA